jgi:protein tyrosine phosphatase (PTP) superfamily phosphohydrolase (DUF442 family)
MFLMRNDRCRFLVTIVALAVALPVAAQSPDTISNYRQYSALYSSSGQPHEAQLETLQKSGFERIIYLAYSDQESALESEDRIVKDLGMEYVHIPVEFGAPNSSEFDIFAAIMRQAPDKKTLLHCQVNYRASAFSLLYRVIYLDVPLADAKEDMNSVWAPNEIWTKLIFDVLQENGKSPFCDVCDWESPQ